MHPAIDDRLFRLLLITPVSLHDGIAAGADFTWLAPWKDLMCLWMSNLDLNVWAGAANCCSFLEFRIILVTNRDDWGSLSHSIALGQVLDAELFRDAIHQGLGGAGPGYKAGAERFNIVLLLFLPILLKVGNEHGWYSIDSSALMLGYCL